MTFESQINMLLKEKLPHPPACIIESSLAHDIDDVLASALPKAKLAVVDDNHTRQAFGDRVFKAVQKQGAGHITFDHPPLPDFDYVQYICQQAKPFSAIVAVGGGTINDICKYAAHLESKPYVVFPTAASMNGYLSANASISFKGYKKTCPASMPLAAFCDMSVIAAAPPRLSKSGLGDSLARPTAQADWLLSHLLLHTPYSDTPFELLAPYEEPLFDRARGVAQHDKESLALLMKVLLLSGLGMTIAHGSYPASQAEHMIAHAYGMMKNAVRSKRGTLHGEEIGVTAITVAERQQQLLRRKPKVRSELFDEKTVAALFGRKVAQEAKKAFDIKHALVAPMHLDKSKWEAAVSRLAPVVAKPERLRAILKAAKAPLTLEDLHWGTEDYDTVIGVAHYLRERFTCLDFNLG